MTIRIPQPTLDEMLRRAEADYPRESCGVLVGQVTNRVATADYFLPCDNTARQEQTRRFLIDPLVYQEIEDKADAEGRVIVSIVHSHPDHPDEPSEFDREHAWPGVSYIIIAVSQGRTAGYRSWRLKDDRQRFVAEPVLS